MSVKPTLSETYEEAKRVEAEKESIDDYPMQSEEKAFGKKPLLLTKPKDEQSHDFEGMVKMMQKLSNRVIDLEKEKEAQKSYKPYYKRREDNNQSKPPPHSPASMNLTEVGMDKFCTFHQQPHSKKNYPQWINSMTLVINQLLDYKLTEGDEEEGKDNQPTEKQEEDALVLWGCVSLFDTEEEGSLKQEKHQKKM